MSDGTEKLRAIFGRVLGLSADTPGELITRPAVPGWDSLRHVRLVIELQREFSAGFSATEVLGLDSFRAAEDLLRSKGVFK